MLEVTGLSGGYEQTLVLHDISLHAQPGEIVALLGRNGTGKTTLMRGLMGLLPRCAGSIALRGEELSKLPTHRRARRGLGYVPQGRDIFSGVTVEENLRYGHVLAGRSMRDPIPDRIVATFPWMRDRLRQSAETLSGGEQQMLAIARVLVADPAILLLDEPTEGLAPVVVAQLGQIIAGLGSDGGPAIILVEQNLRFALRLASRGYVMEKGRIVSEGDPVHLQREDLIARHLSI